MSQCVLLETGVPVCTPSLAPLYLVSSLQWLVSHFTPSSKTSPSPDANANKPQENAASPLTTACPLIDKHLQPRPNLKEFPPFRRGGKKIFSLHPRPVPSLYALNPILSHLFRDASIVFVQELVTDSRLLNGMKFKLTITA